MTVDRDLSGSVMGRLRAVRLERRMTQQDVADRSGMSLNHVYRMERGLNDPRLSFVVRYARAVGVRLTAELMEVTS